MDTTTLQVPLDKSLKSSATIAAREYGFSSLQDLVRLFLTKLANRQIMVNIEEVEERLSPKAERRYEKIINDIKNGRGIVASKDAKDFLRKLRS